MEEGGNEVAALKFLNRWSQQIYPEPAIGNLEGLREFIRLKYVERRWFRPLSASKTPAPATTTTTQVPAAAASAPTARAFPACPAAQAELAVPGKAETFDLLSGLSPQPAIHAQELAELPSLLIQEVFPSVPDTWSANFAEHAPEVATACSGLETLDFNLEAMDATSTSPVVEEKLAAEAVPTSSSEAEESISLGERLRQAVLSGRQEDMREVFEYCSKPSPKQVAHSDRLAAFAAFDALICGDDADTYQPPLQMTADICQAPLPQLPANDCQPPLLQLPADISQAPLQQLPANDCQSSLLQMSPDICQPPLQQTLLEQLPTDTCQPALLQLPEGEDSDATPSTVSSPKIAPTLEESEFGELMTMFNQKMAPELII